MAKTKTYLYKWKSLDRWKIYRIKISGKPLPLDRNNSFRER